MYSYAAKPHRLPHSNRQHILYYFWRPEKDEILKYALHRSDGKAGCFSHSVVLHPIFTFSQTASHLQWVSKISIILSRTSEPPENSTFGSVRLIYLDTVFTLE